MPFQLVNNNIGLPAINDVSTTQKAPLGLVANIADNAETTPHGGEVIYLKASGASIVVGSVVDYDTHLATCVLTPATAGEGPMAVSLNIVPANSFAWFQISGRAAVKAPNAMVPGAAVYMLAATPGSVDDAVVASEQVVGAKVSTTTGTPSTGLGYIEMNRPHHV